jgi:hypothetical protein
MARIFSLARKDLVVAVLGTVGALTALTACQSNEATYRPQPKQAQAPVYSTPPPTYTTPTYPTAPTATQPAARPATGGQMACGKGKCG